MKLPMMLLYKRYLCPHFPPCERSGEQCPPLRPSCLRYQ